MFLRKSYASSTLSLASFVWRCRLRTHEESFCDLQLGWSLPYRVYRDCCSDTPYVDLDWFGLTCSFASSTSAQCCSDRLCFAPSQKFISGKICCSSLSPWSWWTLRCGLRLFEDVSAERLRVCRARVQGHFGAENVFLNWLAMNLFDILCAPDPLDGLRRDGNVRSLLSFAGGSAWALRCGAFVVDTVVQLWRIWYSMAGFLCLPVSFLASCCAVVVTGIQAGDAWQYHWLTRRRVHQLLF